MKYRNSIESLESRIAPAGLVLATYNAVTRELTITGDDSNNSVTVFQTGPTSWRVEGNEDAALVNTSINVAGEERFEIGAIAKLTVQLAGGNDVLELVNLRSLKSLSVDTGAGNDVVETMGLVVKGNATFSMGTGLDAVDLDGLVAAVSGNLSVMDGGDGLTFTFGAASSTVGGAVQFTGGAGADALLMATDTNLKIGRQVEFIGNGGLDRLEFGNQGAVSIGRDALGRSVIYQGGSAADRIGIGSSKVALLGSVEMTGMGGNDTLDIDGGLVSVGRSVAGVSVFLDGGQGADQIDLQGASFSALGQVYLDGGTEADKLDLTGIHRLVLKAGLRVGGGAGADLLDISAESLAVTGNVQFDGGDDADTAIIKGDGTITGSVSLILGAAASGIQSADIRSRSGLPGSLKISGAVVVDATLAAATTLDFAKLTNIKVGGVVSLLMGDGASFLDIDNLVVGGAFSIDTRGGNDDVQIERDATFGTSLFRKLATIMLGGGSDTLFIGKDSKNNRVIFMGDVSADGGAGTDARNDINVDNQFGPGAAYTESAFETLVVPI